MVVRRFGPNVVVRNVLQPSRTAEALCCHGGRDKFLNYFYTVTMQRSLAHSLDFDRGLMLPCQQHTDTKTLKKHWSSINGKPATARGCVEVCGRLRVFLCHLWIISINAWWSALSRETQSSETILASVTLSFQSYVWFCSEENQCLTHLHRNNRQL